MLKQNDADGDDDGSAGNDDDGVGDDDEDDVAKGIPHC